MPNMYAKSYWVSSCLPKSVYYLLKTTPNCWTESCAWDTDQTAPYNEYNFEKKKDSLNFKEIRHITISTNANMYFVLDFLQILKNLPKSNFFSLKKPEKCQICTQKVAYGWIKYHWARYWVSSCLHEKISLKVCTISSKQPQVGTPSPLQGNWENSSEKGPTVKWGTPA